MATELMEPALIEVNPRVGRWSAQGKNLIKWGLALALLGWLGWQNQQGILQVWHQSLIWSFLLAAFSLRAIAAWLSFIRWGNLVRAAGVPMSQGETVRLSFLGMVCNYISPGNVGGDFVRAVAAARNYPQRKAGMVGSVMLDRILGLHGLMTIGGIVAAWQWDFLAQAGLHTLGSVLILAAIGGNLLFLLMLLPVFDRLLSAERIDRLPWMGSVLARMIQGIQQYRTHWDVLLSSLVLSLVGHVCMILALYLCAKALPVQTGVPSLSAHFVFMPATEVAGIVVPLPGGMGVREGSLQTLYALGRISPDISAADARTAGFSASLLFTLITMWIAFLGYLGCLLPVLCRKLFQETVPVEFPQEPVGCGSGERL